MGVKYFSSKQPTPQTFNVRDRTLPYEPASEMVLSENSDSLGFLFDESYGRDWHGVMHGALNYLFGDGSTDIPQKYFDAAGNLLNISYGRCASNIIIDGEAVRHNYLVTYIMPDGIVHVIIFDILFV